MNAREVSTLMPGVYHLTFKSGITSVGAIGISDGKPWYVVPEVSNILHDDDHWTGVESVEFLNLAPLKEEIGKLSAQNGILQRTIEKQKKAISGLEYLAKTRRGIDALSIGTQVATAGGEHGKITSVFIDRGGVRYYVVWWKAGLRYEELLDGSEVEQIDPDMLPIRRIDYGPNSQQGE